MVAAVVVVVVDDCCMMVVGDHCMVGVDDWYHLKLVPCY